MAKQKNLTPKEKGWGAIRIKLTTIRELKIEKAIADVNLYEDLLIKMIEVWRKRKND